MVKQLLYPALEEHIRMLNTGFGNEVFELLLEKAMKILEQSIRLISLKRNNDINVRVEKTYVCLKCVLVEPDLLEFRKSRVVTLPRWVNSGGVKAYVLRDNEQTSYGAMKHALNHALASLDDIYRIVNFDKFM